MSNEGSYVLRAVLLICVKYIQDEFIYSGCTKLYVHQSTMQILNSSVSVSLFVSGIDLIWETSE